MGEDFEATFAALKGVLKKHSKKLVVGSDTAGAYSLLGRVPSPFPQHKGKPMWFSEVRVGKAYVSFHLTPLYMNPPLQALIPANLKKRMQGKACFNFKNVPDAELLAELDQLASAALKNWSEKKWV
ncbi:MAG TPA: hypothetical protein VGN01_18855 [Acidobacteriaceae bacterium]|jgi:hypothetical protein